MNSKTNWNQKKEEELINKLPSFKTNYGSNRLNKDNSMKKVMNNRLMMMLSIFSSVQVIKYSYRKLFKMAGGLGILLVSLIRPGFSLLTMWR